MANKRVKLHIARHVLVVVLAIAVGFLFFLRATDTGSLWQWAIVLVSPIIVVSQFARSVQLAIGDRN